MLENWTVDQIQTWNRQFFPVCAGLYLLLAAIGGYALSRNHRVSRPLIALLLLVALVAGSVYYLPYTNDDAYIFFHYAENLSSGFGPSYNRGELTEGFTSPAWLWILAGAQTAGISTILASKVIGILCALGALTLVMGTGLRLTSNPLLVFLAALLVATNQAFVSWSVSGMDVSLFILWLSALAYTLTTLRQRRAVLWALTASGAWVRPEAVLILPIAWLWVLTREPRNGPHYWMPSALGAAVLIALPSLYRLSVFGEWLPTTYYAKSDRTLRSGLGFLLASVQTYGPLIWIGATVGLWASLRAFWWLAAVVVALAGYVVWVGGDVLTQRFALYWLPFLSVGLILGLKHLNDKSRMLTPLVVGVIATFCAAQELHRMYQAHRDPRGSEGYLYVAASGIATRETDYHIGHFLRASGSPADLVVTDNIGAIGFCSRMRILDVNGLVTPEIARLIHHGEKHKIVDVILSSEAEWIVCYPGPDTAVGEYQLVNVGALPDSILTQYDAVRAWRSRTGYTRVLLRRRQI